MQSTILFRAIHFVTLNSKNIIFKNPTLYVVPEKGPPISFNIVDILIFFLIKHERNLKKESLTGQVNILQNEVSLDPLCQVQRIE